MEIGSFVARQDRREREEWWALMDDEGQPTDLDGRIRPQGLFASLSRHLPDRAILSSDSGTAADWYARHIRIRRGMKHPSRATWPRWSRGAVRDGRPVAFPDRVSWPWSVTRPCRWAGWPRCSPPPSTTRRGRSPLCGGGAERGEAQPGDPGQWAMEVDPRFEASQSIPYVSYADWAQLMVSKASRSTGRTRSGGFTEGFAADRPVIVRRPDHSGRPPRRPTSPSSKPGH